ncbi:MAG: L-threonylcarbamoyladenylate synthase [Spirochaetia bacterium]|jgi:L-threonylcarbamoyladenylate synthase|nr:L-threonylcarbamoyladenylate synthase [Spirochaetia bacterium]
MNFDENSEVLYLGEQKTFDRIVELMNANEVVILPCDTIYGLCAKVGPAEQNLRNIKGREMTKPFIQLATEEQALSICEVPDEIRALWPCPLTCVMNRKDGMGTLAIRVPSDPFLQAVMTKIASPMYSTSVNDSGYEALTNIMDIIYTYKDRIPAFVIGDEKQGTVPSTLLDVTKRPFRILRQGGYDASFLLQ